MRITELAIKGGESEKTQTLVARSLHDGYKNSDPRWLLSRQGGRYWVRTSDLFRVREARYHCANRPAVRLEVKTGFEPVYAALQAAA